MIMIIFLDVPSIYEVGFLQDLKPIVAEVSEVSDMQHVI